MEVSTTNPTLVRSLVRKARAFLVMASPPCQPYSTTRVRGAVQEPALIEETRGLLGELKQLGAIENVPGARAAMPNAKLLRGGFFGLHVDRPRLFECNFDFHVDAALKDGGDLLRRGTCLGHRRRWRRLDPFGRPEMATCCEGNLWALQGDKPYRCTPCECASAMGVAPDHMTYEGLTQAIPPAYSQLIFGLAHRGHLTTTAACAGESVTPAMLAQGAKFACAVTRGEP